MSPISQLVCLQASGPGASQQIMLVKRACDDLTARQCPECLPEAAHSLGPGPILLLEQGIVQ